jgi:hypothetical protein
MPAMQIETSCPRCESSLSAEGPPWPAAVACGCGGSRAIPQPEGLASARPLDRCPICDSDEFYVQKDFSRTIGISIVAAGILLYVILPMPWKLVGLGGTWLLDLALYFVVPWLTVCYRCRTLFRGFPRNPAHKTFDLHTAEQYAK